MAENETKNETKTKSETPDLSHLASLKPVQTEFRTVKRGRTPGKNPMDVHVKAAYDAGTALALPITAGVAFPAERQARRSGTRLGYKMSVQVLDVEPGKATNENVIPMRNVKAMEPSTDVWLVIKAEPQPAESETKAAKSTDSGDVKADPFAGSPEAPATVPTNGGKGKGKVPAVANP